MFAISLGDGAELRPLEPWRAEEFLAHMDRGREHIGRYVGLADAAADLGSARSWLQSYADKAAADTGRVYGIWLDGLLVGGVLFRIFDAEAGNCEAGCWLEPAATGRGLVTRAARVLIDWAVEERGMHRVEWLVAPANAPSIAVADDLRDRDPGVRRRGVEDRLGPQQPARTPGRTGIRTRASVHGPDGTHAPAPSSPGVRRTGRGISRRWGGGAGSGT